MNLILAFIWLVVGLVILAVPWLPPAGRLLMAQQGLTAPLGGLALLLSLYNVVRWWFSKPMVANRRAVREARARRRDGEAEGNAPSLHRAPDPNFNFSDPPPERSASSP